MIQSLALVLLLGFELSYYLLIVQTGITEHYDSNLITLFPLFIGGVVGTLLSGLTWGKITNPMHKIFIALVLQLVLSFLYPHYNLFTLFLLGLCVGLMAPLSIYLFKEHQRRELLVALAIAYTVGTYGFTSFTEQREWMAIVFSTIVLVSAILLRHYKVEQSNQVSRPYLAYIPLMLWILLDSNLFETLSRHAVLNIWSEKTYTIILFHLIGLLVAFLVRVKEREQHFIIALLFAASYAFSYFECKLGLSIVYPFTISYYNVIVFITLTKERRLQKLSYLMVFIGWVASGLGLALALSKIFH